MFCSLFGLRPVLLTGKYVDGECCSLVIDDQWTGRHSSEGNETLILHKVWMSTKIAVRIQWCESAHTDYYLRMSVCQRLI